MSSYKVIIVGNTKRGKTQWVNRLLFKKEEGDYSPTQGVNVSSLTLPSRNIVKIWDIGGKYRGLGNGYYIGASAALIFADNEEEASYWVHDVLRICPLIALLVVTQDPLLFSNNLPIKNKNGNPSSILEEIILEV